MTTFYIADSNRQTKRSILAFKGDVKNHSLDCNVWADDYGTVTTITWSVESGSGAISNASVASNVGTMTLTTSDTTSGIIKALITDGTNTEAVYIHYKAIEPVYYTDIPDYGLA